MSKDQQPTNSSVAPEVPVKNASVDPNRIVKQVVRPVEVTTTPTAKPTAESNPKQPSSSSNNSTLQASPPAVLNRRRYCKPNYYKYQNIKDRLVDLLKTGHHQTGFIAHQVGISSTSTLFKYQSLAEKETGLLLISQEEHDYLKTNLSPNEMAKIESKLRAQNKDWTEAGRNSETESKPAEAEPNPIIPTDQVKTPPPLESRRKPSQKVKG